MNTEQILELTSQYIMPTYGRLPIAFVRGEGARLWDAEGKEYLDFVAGIAVLGVGHCHPKVVEAIREQAGLLMHTSNLYNIAPQALLAKKLSELSFGGKTFFCNSGAEANEAAIKLARKWAHLNRPDIEPDDRVILTALHSFHGRTVTTVTATGQPKYQKCFEPTTPGFEYFEFGDLDDLKAKLGRNVCAVMIEPIQAEGGMNVPPEGYLTQVRSLCDEAHCLLIVDEVQTGLARTGQWFAYMHEDIEPDIITLAKALGGGFPIGCCVAKREVADCFEPGNHASTFGGSHLACTAALAALGVMEEEELVENSRKMGEVLAEALGPDKHPHIVEVRGRGLLRAVRFAEGSVDARQVQDKCREMGLLVNALGSDRLRLAPPLNITAAEVKQAAGTILAALDAV
ncbi:aspartate aminotransferase family protein [bacterium]|nr:aspartate aminotransferase family protein [bacterium]